MTVRRALRVYPVVMLAMLSPGPMRAAESAAARPVPAQPTAAFLEYLGTLEGVEDNWTDFQEAAARPAGNGRTEPAASSAESR